MIKRLFFFIMTLALLLSACTDNDSFTTDRSHRLTFQSDTIRLDTLFSAVPSVTYGFWVHNHSGDGVRISTVRLEHGNQTGFRVNVDGSFLNPVAQDLEVRQGDSLLVFIEITSRENGLLEPQLVEDNLLFTLESGVEQRVNLRTWSWDAEKLTDLVVDHDMTIESERPVVVYGSGISVAEGAVLTLRNTQFFFHDEAGLQVKGQLVAEDCLFRGDRLDHMFSYLPYDRVSGQWRGISVQDEGSYCTMTRCEVRNAWDAIRADSTRVELYDCVLHNNRGYGLYAANSDVVLSHCQLSNAEGDCLSLHGSTAQVDHCTLAQFYPFVGGRGAALRFAAADRPLSLQCSNTLVTGYEDDVLMGTERDGETVSYRFVNCVLRTPEVDDAEAFQDIIWEKSTDEVQGKQHFLVVDEENLYYDFRLDTLSTALKHDIGRITQTE